MPLSLFDSATREKRAFKPQDSQHVTLYVCGPTVYARAHIGNMRPAVVFDVLFRLLREMYGAEHVLYARNITDIDDKIITKARESGESIQDITTRYQSFYEADTDALNVLAPTISPKASAHIPQMLTLITALERKAYAYQTPAGVFFSVPQMADYGRLSGRNLDDNLAGARVEIDLGKRHPSDFALWKSAKPGEPEEATWDSPWGRGRPGWHIECSAMIATHLGKTIDIHGGGIDLQFPHHENEIAQSECAHGQVLANYWLHNGFLDMQGEKMSKSLGNVSLVSELLETYRGEVLRFALLSAHYRAQLDWTQALLQQASTTLNRLYGALRRVWAEEGAAPNDMGVQQALEDDLNTPMALSALSRLASEANGAADRQDRMAMAQARADLLAGGALLGLLTQTPQAWEQGENAGESARIEELIAERLAARASKDWAEADRIRDALLSEGIDIMDSPTGSTWRRLFKLHPD